MVRGSCGSKIRTSQGILCHPLCTQRTPGHAREGAHMRRHKSETIRYKMTQRMIAIGQDFWIEDDHGHDRHDGP